MSPHQSRELITHGLQQAQSVILSQRVQEVLHNVALVAAHELLQLLHDLLLVGDGEGRGANDASQLAVLLEGFAERRERLGGLVQRRGFDGCGVLGLLVTSFLFSFFLNSPPGKGRPDQIEVSVELVRPTYQGSGIGAGNTEQGHRRPHVLGWGGIGPQAGEGGSARDGELLRSGTQAGTGEASGEHCGRYTTRGESRERGSCQRGAISDWL